MVKFLIESGVYVNIKSNNDGTALKFAIDQGYNEFVDLLKKD